MIHIHRVTYDLDGELFVKTVTPITNPVQKTAAEWVNARLACDRGWIATSGNQVARVDEGGFLDVVTYLEKGE